ncbi:MAG: hypothetical protein ACOX0R_01935 [Candidatus Dojkabacteria bacterium]
MFFSTSVFAQQTELETTTTEENTMDTKYFDLELVRLQQTPFGKSVTYALYIKPLMDSPKTEILWSYPPTLDVRPKHARFIAMKEGETYTVKAVVKPENPGTYNLSVSVISWQHDTNYTNSTADSLTFDGNLIIQPVSSEYKIISILMTFGIVIIIGVLIFVIIKLSKKGAEKAKKWLTPPN